MFKINSTRAQALLDRSEAIRAESTAEMRRYPGKEFNLWMGVSEASTSERVLSFAGEFTLFERLILETAAQLAQKRGLKNLDSLTVRECEAYLRDRNSVPAYEGVAEENEAGFKKLFGWMSAWAPDRTAETFVFDARKRPLRDLGLVERVKTLKAFLRSSEILDLYRAHPLPELVDVDDLTVYVHAPYSSEEERAIFEELHMLGVATFQEEELNFIPEAEGA